MSKQRRQLELLAPAKDLQTAQCAVDYGADALYMGASRFGARFQAGNSVDQIAQAVEYAHNFGVKVFATLNTLLFEDELSEARTLTQELTAVGVDALIVQDMAYKQMDLPNMALHASTQMCNISGRGVKSLEQLGFTRVVLERGLTLDQIKAIRSETTVELEAFVHGAICVGYSGQCYLSRTMGERSGNRGNCMQACRMAYDLVDASGKTLIKNKHLLSVQDMNLLQNLEQLIDAGVDSFKIEGRLKNIDYIKNSVAAYRKALDSIILRRSDLERSSLGESIFDFEPDLTRTFTRGGDSYFLLGKKSGIANFNTPKAMGAYMGEVVRCSRGEFELKGGAKLNAGDGICFTDKFGNLCGTNINKADGLKIEPNDMTSIEKGVEIYRNFDKQFSDLLSSSRTRRVIDLSARVSTNTDKIKLYLCDSQSIEISAEQEGNFPKAQNQLKMQETIQKQISKSGASIFKITEVKIDNNEELNFVPISALNELRRNALEAMEQKRRELYLRPEKGITNSQVAPPPTTLGSEYNVTNSLSRQFWMDRGVSEICEGYDLRASAKDFEGERVLSSSYCIRREIGQCLKNKHSLDQDLFLVYKDKKYKLEFDCKNCQMNLIYER